MDADAAKEVCCVLRLSGADLASPVFLGLTPFRVSEGNTLHYDIPLEDADDWDGVQDQLESFLRKHVADASLVTSRAGADALLDIAIFFRSEKMSLNVPLRPSLMAAAAGCFIAVNLAIYRTA